MSGIGVGDLDDEEARETWRDPLLVEVVGLLLLDAVVGREVEAVGVLGCEVWVGRLSPKVRDIVRKVAMEDHQRVVGLGVLVEVLRHQHVGGEVDVPAPELRQAFAADADVADKLAVGLGRDGRDLAVERHRQALIR